MGPGVRRDDVRVLFAARSVRPLSRACGGGLGWGFFGNATRGESPHPALCATLPRKREREEENHTDAVVTPPSTMMVCPVMKLEASEPR
jgi:hypothetical protein